MVSTCWAGKLVCLLCLVVAFRHADAVKCQTKDGLTTFQVLEQAENVTIFSSLIRQSGMIPIFSNKRAQFTIFAPLDYAFGNLLPTGSGFFDIFPGKEIPKVIVNYHTTVPVLPPAKLREGLNYTAGLLDPKGKPMKFNITENPLDPLKPFVMGGAVNTANITRPLGKTPGIVACNSVIYFIDEVLLPSEKLLPSKKPRVTVAAAEKTALSFEPLVSPRKKP